MKEFESSDGGVAGLYDEESQAAAKQAAAQEQARINSVPGLLAPALALPDEMADEL